MKDHIQASDIELEKKQVSRLTGISADLIQLNESGWSSRVYLVDGGRFVVKFPPTKSVKKEYTQEIKVFKLLEQLGSDVQVPKLRWTHPDNTYIGYEGIVGVEFDKAAGAITDEHRIHIGHSIGQFLRLLHAQHLENPHIMTIEDEIKQIQTKYLACLPIIAKSFTQSEQATVDKFIKHGMPLEMHRLGSRPVLCHGDIGYYNIILKSDGHIGLIDFGDVGNYDQSKDFCGLQDEEILTAALEKYGNDDVLLDKISIRRKSIPFLDLMHFWQHEDKDKIQATFTKIRIELGLV